MVTHIELVHDEKVLRGTLHKPCIDMEKCPLIIMYHGFTGYKDEIHRMFVKMSRALEAVGIASLRVDFSGSGDSDGYFRNMTFSGELKEAEAILDYGLVLDFVDRRFVSLLGLSMGGAVASVVAAKRSKDVYKLCLWGAAGSLKSVIFDLIESRTDIPLKDVDFVDYLGFDVGIPFIQELDSIDVFQMSSGFNGEVLIIHGEKDEVVPVENARCYEELYIKPKVELVEGADHVFQRLDWEERVLHITKHFLLKERR